MEQAQQLKWAALGVILALVAYGIYLLATPQTEAPPAVEVATYDECVAAGYPVTLTDPATCRTPDGTVFVQEVSTPSVPAPLVPLPTPPTSPGGPDYEY